MKNYQLEKAFLLGFMVSRQGFNGECAYGHLAHELAHDCSVAEFEEKMQDNRAFVALQKQAMEILEKEHHCKLERINSELIAALNLISNHLRAQRAVIANALDSQQER